MEYMIQVAGALTMASWSLTRILRGQVVQKKIIAPNSRESQAEPSKSGGVMKIDSADWSGLIEIAIAGAPSVGVSNARSRPRY